MVYVHFLFEFEKNIQLQLTQLTYNFRVSSIRFHLPFGFREKIQIVLISNTEWVL